MVKDHSGTKRKKTNTATLRLLFVINKKISIICIIIQEGRKEMFYLMMHSTHFIYGYMASEIW